MNDDIVEIRWHGRGGPGMGKSNLCGKHEKLL